MRQKFDELRMLNKALFEILAEQMSKDEEIASNFEEIKVSFSEIIDELEKREE